MMTISISISIDAQTRSIEKIVLETDNVEEAISAAERLRSTLAYKEKED